MRQRNLRIDKTRRATFHRSGGVTLEFIIALPLLIIVTLAVFQFGILMIVQQAVAHAATVGAREAGKGVDATTVVAAINKVLAPHCIEVIDGDASSNAKVIVEVGSPMPAPPVVTILGDPGLDCNVPVATNVAPDEVRVTICVDLITMPICNALVSFGAEPDFTGKRFEISALVKKEL